MNVSRHLFKIESNSHAGKLVAHCDTNPTRLSPVLFLLLSFPQLASSVTSRDESHSVFTYIMKMTKTTDIIYSYERKDGFIIGKLQGLNNDYF